MVNLGQADRLLIGLNSRGYNVHASDIDVSGPLNIGSIIERGPLITFEEYLKRTQEGESFNYIPTFDLCGEKRKYFIIPTCDTPNDPDLVMQNGREQLRKFGIYGGLIGPFFLRSIEIGIDISQLPTLK